MLRGLARILLSGLIVTCVAPCAWAQLGPVNVAMSNQLRYSQLRIMGGRIKVTTDDPARAIDYSSQIEDREERLQLSSVGGLVTMNYQLATPKFRYFFEVQNGSQVTIRREPAARSNHDTWELTQKTAGPLVLRIGKKDSQRQVIAPTFWHLFLAEPEFCRKELVPLMEVVRPNWRLVDDAALLVSRLVQAPNSANNVDRQRVWTLILQLGSDKYVERQAADRELREMGSALLPLLRGIKQSQLDAEQRYRLTAIENDFSGQDREDSPEIVALWMAGDPHTWLALLQHPEPATRRVALEQLKRLLGTELEFTPEADEPTRAAQLKTITEQVEQFWKF